MRVYESFCKKFGVLVLSNLKINRFIKFVDRVIGAPNGQRHSNGPNVYLVAETSTAKEIISSRVKEEWRLCDPASNQGFTTRDDLMNWILKGGGAAPKTVDIAVSAAMHGFENGLFLFFWNDQQVTDLEERLDVMGDNEAMFLRLLPMIGG